MNTPPTIRRATKPSHWPRFFATATITQFEAMGWASDDWHDVDHELAFITAWRPEPARQFYSLREWLRNPPTFQAPISPALFASTVAAYGRGLAPMALDALASGASPRFVAAFQADYLTGSRTGFRYKTARPDVAWATTSAAGLSEADATGWALTGQLLADPDTQRVVDVDLVNAQLLPWVDRLGPGSWLFLLAGFTLDEAGQLKDAGTTPTTQQLQVMAALAGHTDYDQRGWRHE